MAKVHAGRFTADHDGDVVVFLIGMRINRPWRVQRWWPVFTAMPRMLRHLREHPEEGLLHSQGALMFGGPAVVQWWRSVEELNRFARDPEAPHLEPWRTFNRVVGSSGDVGIWHETYVVSRGRSEAVYANMPVTGLAAATAHAPVERRGHSAAERMGLTAVDDVAVP